MGSSSKPKKSADELRVERLQAKILEQQLRDLKKPELPPIEAPKLLPQAPSPSSAGEDVVQAGMDERRMALGKAGIEKTRVAGKKDMLGGMNLQLG